MNALLIPVKMNRWNHVNLGKSITINHVAMSGYEEDEARRMALISECVGLDEADIDFICKDNGYTSLDYDMLEMFIEMGEGDGHLCMEDECFEYNLSDVYELSMVTADINGEPQEILIPSDESLLLTREKLAEMGKLPSETNKPYMFNINLYIGNIASGEVEKEVPVIKWGASEKEAEFEAMLDTCMATTREEALKQIEEHGVWDTCDESGAYTLAASCEMLMVDINVKGKDYVVFVPKNCIGVTYLYNWTLGYWQV